MLFAKICGQSAIKLVSLSFGLDPSLSPVLKPESVNKQKLH